MVRGRASPAGGARVPFPALYSDSMRATSPESDPSFDPPPDASARVLRAAERAGEDARSFFADPSSAWPSGAAAGTAARPRARRLAIGDPQAPLTTFLEILDRNDLLADDGRLHPEVFLATL